jgi:hypothetical protein
MSYHKQVFVSPSPYAHLIKQLIIVRYYVKTILVSTAMSFICYQNSKALG